MKIIYQAASGISASLLDMMIIVVFLLFIDFKTSPLKPCAFSILRKVKHVIIT